MSDFLLTEAIDEDEDEIENEGNDFVSTLSDEEFIDDESQFENNASDYYGLVNIERSYDDAIQDSISDINFDQEANNYNFDDDDFNDEEIDDFKDFTERLNKFNQNIEIEEIYRRDNNLPPWNLNFELLNGDFAKSITIKSRQELGYFYLLPNRGEEITYKFEKEHC